MRTYLSIVVVAGAGCAGRIDPTDETRWPFADVRDDSHTRDQVLPSLHSHSEGPGSTSGRVIGFDQRLCNKDIHCTIVNLATDPSGTTVELFFSGPRALIPIRSGDDLVARRECSNDKVPACAEVIRARAGALLFAEQVGEHTPFLPGFEVKKGPYEAHSRCFSLLVGRSGHHATFLPWKNAVRQLDTPDGSWLISVDLCEPGFTLTAVRVRATEPAEPGDAPPPGE